LLAALGTSDAIALGAAIVALIAVAVAVWSAGEARKANKLSQESNTIAEGSNAISKESNEIAREALKHSARGVELAEASEQERIRQAQARAVMQAEFVPSPLVFVSDGSFGNFRPLVRVRNVGDQDSGRTTIRLYMVAGQDMMAWDDEQTRHDRVRPRIDPDVTFCHPTTQAPLPTQFIERTVENVTPRMPVELRVVIPMAIPAPSATGRNVLPVRIVVRADNADEPVEWTENMQTEFGRSG
jgi:hypothetical protein